jgi:hypothetical protein
MAKNKKKTKVEALKVLETDTYYVLDKTTHDHELEYIINAHQTEKGTLVEMFVADNGLWSPSVAGKKVASVMDTGDGYEWEVSPVSKEHDHSDAYVMMIMMNFLDSLNSIRSKYEIVATSKLIDVTHN